MRLNYGVTFQPQKEVLVVDSYIVLELDVFVPRIISIQVPDTGSCRRYLTAHFKLNSTGRVCNEYNANIKSVVDLQRRVNKMIRSTLDDIQSLMRHKENIRRRTRSTNGLLPVVGKLSEILFGTATVQDLSEQNAFLKSLSVSQHTVAGQTQFLGAAVLAVINTTTSRLNMQMQSIMENTDFLVNLSKTMDIHRMKNRLLDHIRRQHMKLEMDTVHLQYQLTRLKNDVVGLLENKVNPTLFSLDDIQAILQTAGRLLDTSSLRTSKVRLPNALELYGHIELFSPPKFKIEESKLILNIRIPVIVADDKYFLYRVNKFPLPFHGRYTQLFGNEDYLLMSESQTKFATPNDAHIRSCDGSSCFMDIFRQPVHSNTCLTALWTHNGRAIKSLCDFRFLVSATSGYVYEVDQNFYLLANIENVSLTCNSSTILLKGCKSCLKKFPCGCSVMADTWTFTTPLNTCFGSSDVEPLTLYPVNMASLQHLNMTFNNFIDPTALYSSPLTLYPLSDELRKRQEKIFAKDNIGNIALGKYMKAISAHQEEFNRLYDNSALAIQPTKEFYLFWVNRAITFLVTPVLFVVVVLLCVRIRKVHSNPTQSQDFI